MFTYLHAVVVPTAVFAAAEDWTGATARRRLRSRIQRAARQLAEQMNLHESTPVTDPFALPASFEELLSSE
jgi:FMN reductase